MFLTGHFSFSKDSSWARAARERWRGSMLASCFAHSAVLAAIAILAPGTRSNDASHAAIVPLAVRLALAAPSAALPLQTMLAAHAARDLPPPAMRAPVPRLTGHSATAPVAATDSNKVPSSLEAVAVPANDSSAPSAPPAMPATQTRSAGHGLPGAHGIQRSPAIHAAAMAEAAAQAPRFDAAYLHNEAPAYPALSRRVREQGRVLVRVLVDVNGVAASVELSASSGSARLDQSALDAVKRWKFVPARKGELPVSAWVVVPILFSLNG